ncbi:MAG TPA: hypothetical protein VF469_28235 [Kofleriaceae bacterium]
MRLHRIIFLAAITCATGCTTHKKEVETAKRSLYDTDFTVVYTAALEATRETYPNIEDAPGRGAIKTAWHQVSYANNNDDMTNPRTLANAQGMNSAAPASASAASAGMPTRLAYKRYFIRFDISVAGGRPWRLKVVGHASEWEPGAALPTELHGPARPSWLEGRTDALLYAIYQKIKSYAVPMKEEVASSDDVKHTDPAAFGAIPPAAGKQLAAIKDVLGVRDYAGLRAQLAADVVWSLGGGSGADGALALWQADPEPLDGMTKALAAGCGGDAKKVTCPAAPAAGSYQLTLEPRPEGWRITSFVKLE